MTPQQNRGDAVEQYGQPRAFPRWASFEGLLSGLNSVGTLWIFVLMVIVNADVVGRTAFTSPLPGVPEFVQLSIVGIIFLQLAHTLRCGRIIRADFLLRVVRRRWPRVGFGFEVVFALGGAGLFAVLFYASYPYFLRSWTSAEYAGIEGYITFPIWPVRLIILIGCALACIQFLIFAWQNLSALLGRRPPGADQAAHRDAIA